MPCHSSLKLHYAMPHGTYVKFRTCHMAIKQDLGHAMWQLYMNAYVMLWMPHDTEAKFRPCHMAFN